jgi:hypothetical protein
MHITPDSMTMIHKQSIVRQIVEEKTWEDRSWMKRQKEKISRS